MITTEFVMQKLAEPFDARDVAKPLKDEPLTRPLYNEYMRDNRGPRNTPPRVQMQVGTPTLNQERMKQDIASFGERLGVNSMGGSALGQDMNRELAAQSAKDADEVASKNKRKITTARVNGVVGRVGKGNMPLQQVSVNKPPAPGEYIDWDDRGGMSVMTDTRTSDASSKQEYIPQDGQSVLNLYNEQPSSPVLLSQVPDRGVAKKIKNVARSIFTNENHDDYIARERRQQAWDEYDRFIKERDEKIMKGVRR